MGKRTIGWINLNSFTNNILLCQHNYIILVLLKGVDISQLEHLQV